MERSIDSLCSVLSCTEAVGSTGRQETLLTSAASCSSSRTRCSFQGSLERGLCPRDSGSLNLGFSSRVSIKTSFDGWSIRRRKSRDRGEGFSFQFSQRSLYRSQLCTPFTETSTSTPYDIVGVTAFKSEPDDDADAAKQKAASPHLPLGGSSTGLSSGLSLEEHHAPLLSNQHTPLLSNQHAHVLSNQHTPPETIPSSGSWGQDGEKEGAVGSIEGLPTLQVLSAEEQAELAAQAAHPAALNAMYASYFFNCFVEHAWRFAWPAVLSMLHSSLLPVAVASFVSQFVIFVAAPWVGELMDAAPRVLAFNLLSVVQTITMLASAMATAHAFSSGAATAAVAAGSSGAQQAGLLLQPWFLVLVAAGAVERVTGLASGVAFERDWVVQLAGSNRPLALASANAMLRRVDLICEVVGPLVVAWLLSSFSPITCLNASAAAMLLSLPILLGLVSLTNYLAKGALSKSRHQRRREGGVGGDKAEGSGRVQREGEEAGSSHVSVKGAASERNSSSSSSSGGTGEGSRKQKPALPLPPSPFASILSGWRSYFSQPVFPASLAYVLLYFNAVLSPGGLMTSFLAQKGVDVSVSGAFRGACAAVGFAATFASSPLISRFGLLKTGALALIFQSIILAVSVAVFCLSPAGSQGPLIFFLGLVVLSRLGHWTYDVVDAQILQTAIPPNQANSIGSAEIALSSLAELIMLGVAIVIHDVKHFGQLAALSMAAVFGATLLYCVWLSRPNMERQKMFPEEGVFEEKQIDANNYHSIPHLLPSIP